MGITEMRALLAFIAVASAQVDDNQVIIDDGESVQVQTCSAKYVDYTVIPGKIGGDVTHAVHDKLVAKLNIVDRGFIINYAFVETEFGKNTFDRYEFQQSIWALTRDQFEQTKEHYMKSYVAQVNMAFNIEWEAIRYEEMNVPLYSGLAFQIYLVSINAYPIGWGVDAQGDLYADITSQPSIQWQTYIARLVQIQNKLCQNQETDLVFLVDESGSIGQDNFSIMRSFVSNVIGRLNIGETNTRVSLRTYSDPAKAAQNNDPSDLHFSLNNFNEDLVGITEDVPYDCDKCRTYTDTGISDVMDIDFQADAGMRELSKKVLVVITDGESTEPLKTAEQAKRIHSDARNIQVIAIGVAGANLTELELIATTKEQVFFLDNFAAFDLVQETIAESICDAPILSEDGAIVGIVVGGTETSEFDGILNGNIDIEALFPNGVAPGVANFQLTMSGRTFIKIKASQKLDFYLSYSQVTPNPSRYDFKIQYTETMAGFEVEVDLQVIAGTTFFYISAYNFESTNARVQIEIESDIQIALDPLIIPLTCGQNAKCAENGKCICNDGYFGDAYTSCQYDLCGGVSCDDAAVCNPSNGQCECRDGYALINGVCMSPLCPTEPVIATENQYGYAMGYLMSPFYGQDEYPTNFDCEYQVTAPRTEGSCYEIHIEHPFSLETSRSCRNDRLEIFNILNAADISMDPAAEDTTAVLCGNACIADGGWIGRTCSSDLRLRFKSDSLITASGWKIKWILRPKEDCECWCNN